jgi:hypothetical protein
LPKEKEVIELFLSECSENLKQTVEGIMNDVESSNTLSKNKMTVMACESKIWTMLKPDSIPSIQTQPMQGMWNDWQK